MRYLLILPIVFSLGCQSAPPYRSAMAEQCMSTDPAHFEMLTDAQLRQCNVWLNSPNRATFSTAVQPPPSTVTCVDLGGGLISCPNNQTLFIIQ
jgi:hypothetical protein